MLKYHQSNTEQNPKNMNTITAQFTDEELTNLGRAMERSGYTSIEEFFKASILERVRAALSTPNQD